MFSLRFLCALRVSAVNEIESGSDGRGDMCCPATLPCNGGRFRRIFRRDRTISVRSGIFKGCFR